MVCHVAHHPNAPICLKSKQVFYTVTHPFISDQLRLRNEEQYSWLDWSGHCGDQNFIWASKQSGKNCSVYD